MAIRSVTSAYFSEERTIDATGVDVVELAEPCSSVIIQFHPGAVGYTLILDNGIPQGDGPKEAVNFTPGTVITIDSWRLHTITVTGAVGATWSYMAFVKPFTGLGFSTIS